MHAFKTLRYYINIFKKRQDNIVTFNQICITSQFFQYLKVMFIIIANRFSFFIRISLFLIKNREGENRNEIKKN